MARRRAAAGDEPRDLWLALGANLGDPMRQLAAAIERLEAVVGRLELSSVYRSAAVGYTAQPEFLNLVARGATALPPLALLGETSRVERELGREPSFRNAPRPIDIDILALGRLVLRSPELTLPHPRLHERGFVLIPLAELAPAWVHPVTGLTPARMLAAAAAAGTAERVGPLPRLAGPGG